MTPLLLLVILVVLLALAFDYSNGFHDAANAIATVVATRTLRPFQAVAWAAFFNFVAAFAFGVAVAKTIGKGVIDPKITDVYVILAALIGAISWNITTWYYGLPSSSSHALIGGLVGAALVKAGPSAVIASGLKKIALFIVLSPLVGMLLAVILMSVALWTLQNAPPAPVTRWARRLQLLSSALFSLGHGTQDAQKTMGIIAVVLATTGSQIPLLQHAPAWFMPPKDLESIPWWIILAAHAAIGMGTLSGGWRIIRTMGMRITDLEPVGGVCAELAGAFTLLALAMRGIPVSTTHTITGAIVGVGASRRLSAVRWGVAAHIVWAWVLTIPAAATLSAIAYSIVGIIWPSLPLIGQALLGGVVAATLVYCLAVWLRNGRRRRLAHA